MLEQPFVDEQQLMETVNAQLRRWGRQLNETDRRVMEVLEWYSREHLGITQLKVDDIAEDAGRSVRSVQRSIRKLENLAIIERQKKAAGRQPNVYIFLPEGEWDYELY